MRAKSAHVNTFNSYKCLHQFSKDKCSDIANANHLAKHISKGQIPTLLPMLMTKKKSALDKFLIDF